MPEEPIQTAPEAEAQPVSRRNFVVGGVAAAAAIAAAAGALGRPATSASAQTLAKGVVTADPSLCIGCLACEVNCSSWHASVGRSAEPRIRVMRTPQVSLQPALAALQPARAGFTPQTCRQCPTAWCVPNCPTEALQVDARTGNRYINEAGCIACGKCEVDCPITWEGTWARKDQPLKAKRLGYDAKTDVYVKCDLCQGRPEGPICVERCPVNQAIRTGYLASDHLCLDVKESTEAHWKSLT